MWHPQAFLIYRAGIGSKAAATDVNDMAGGCHQGLGLPVAKDRGDDHEIEKMASAAPGVVGDEDIAGLHAVQRVALEEMSDGGGHGVDMARGTGHGLRDHAPALVVNTCRQVARLPRNGAKGGAQQDLGAFLDHGNQTVPQDLAAYLLAHDVRGLQGRIRPWCQALSARLRIAGQGLGYGLLLLEQQVTIGLQAGAPVPGHGTRRR